jgi:hypothetical protein
MPIVCIVFPDYSLYQNQPQDTALSAAGFPTNIILYSSLLGSAIRVMVNLSGRSRIKWVDAIKLTLLRPLVGMGVTLLILLAAFSGVSKILPVFPALGSFWGYISLSSLIGYSDLLINNIIKFLEKGISIKLGNAGG